MTFGDLVQSGSPGASPVQRVSVPLPALHALIEYADTMKSYADQEFLCSEEERAASDREFAALVDALGIGYQPATDEIDSSNGGSSR